MAGAAAERAEEVLDDTSRGQVWAKWHAERPDMEWHLGFADIRPSITTILESLRQRASDRGMKILDVGCGTSAMGVEVLEAVPHAEVVLLDAVGDLVKMLQQRYSQDERIHCVQADCRRLPEAGLVPASFDVVLDKGTFDVLDSEEEREQMLSGILHLLRPGGLIVSVSFATASRLLWLRRAADAAKLTLRVRALPAGKETRLLAVLGDDAALVTEEDSLTQAVLARLLYSGPLRGEHRIAFQDPQLPQVVTVEQDPDEVRSAGEDATGRVVWPAAHALAAYLCSHRHLVEGRRVVELGAGTGLTGLVAAALGAEVVVLTDLPSAMPLLERNISRNAAVCAGRARGEVLWWGSDIPASFLPCDLVVGCEVIYQHDAETAEALVQTMLTLMGSTGMCLMVYEFREGMLADAEFFERANDSFEVEACSMDPYGFRPVDEEGSRLLYIYKPKKPAS